MFDLSKTGHLITLILLFPFGMFRFNPSVEIVQDEDAVDLAQSVPIHAMTFNLRFASSVSPNSWEARRPVLTELIRRQAPDLMGTQEGLHDQLKDMEADLPDYEWVGQGRDGGRHGEYMAIFYRKDRLELLAHDSFWLSRSPDVVGSRSWGNLLPRMATWAKFRERASGLSFYCLNTHFDHLSPWSRDKSAELILRRIAEWDSGAPVVVLGDFNCCAQGSSVHQTFVKGGFRDAWVQAKNRGESLATFHNYGGPMPGGRRIDWILVRGPALTERAELVTFSQNGQYPSDHFPVSAHLRFALPADDDPDSR